MPKRMLQGVVLSTKMQKTIVIAVERRYKHPVMKKVVRRTKHYKAHDESNQAMVGQLVWIRECRPISKSKTWELMSDNKIKNDTANHKTTKKTKKK
ncbi:MAG: 30S ribosomal protein S17 [Alphaproteobacteria bacterium]